MYPVNVWFLEAFEESFLIRPIYGRNVAWNYSDYADEAMGGCVRLGHAPAWWALGAAVRLGAPLVEGAVDALLKNKILISQSLHAKRRRRYVVCVFVCFLPLLAPRALGEEHAGRSVEGVLPPAPAGHVDEAPHGAPAAHPLVGLERMAKELCDYLENIAFKMKQFEKAMTKAIGERAESELSFDEDKAKKSMLAESDRAFEDHLVNNLSCETRQLTSLLSSEGGGDDDNAKARALALRKLHQKELKELNYEIEQGNKRAKANLAAKLAARRAKKQEQLHDKGAPQEAIDAEMRELDKADNEERAELLSKLNDSAEKKIAEELARQRKQEEDGVDPAEELARLLKGHAESLSNLQRDLEADKKKKHELLKAKLAARRKMKASRIPDGEDANAVMANFDAEAAIEEQQLLNKVEVESKKAIQVAMRNYAKTEKAATEDANYDDDLARLRRLHEKEIANLTATLSDKHAQSRKSLEERMALRRAKKREQLAKFNASQEEIQEAEEQLNVEDQEDRDTFEASVDEELVAKVAEEKQRQADQLSSGEGADYDSELARLKALHEERLKDLKRETDKSMKERKSALKKRLEARRKRKESELKNVTTLLRSKPIRSSISLMLLPRLRRRRT